MWDFIIGIFIGVAFSPILIRLAKAGYSYISKKVKKLEK